MNNAQMQKSINDSIQLLECAQCGAVTQNGQPLSKDEIIDAVIDILKGVESHL